MPQTLALSALALRMPDTPKPHSKTSMVLLPAGAALALLGLLADLVGIGGARGLGLKQVLLLLAGAGLLAAGVAASPALRRRAGAAWRASPVLRPGTCLWVAAWFGLCTGVIEVVHLGIQKFGFGVLLKMPVHLVWMVPACYLGFLLVPGLLAAALASLAPGRVRLPALVFVSIAVMTFSQVFLHAWLDQGALLLLCLVVAHKVAWSWGSREAALRFMRRTLPVVLGVVVVAGAVAASLDPLAEWRVRANQPPAPAGAKNVLLVVLDTVRADHLPLYGYRRDTTPNIDALAADGVVFDQAISGCSWTLPSHATMFTGHYHHELSCDWLKPLDDHFPTLAEVFSRHGYATAGFVGNLMYCVRDTGLDRGFEHYEDIPIKPITALATSALGRRFISERTSRRHVGRNTAKEVTDGFLSWLPERGNRPFFAFLNFIDAHAWYVAPEPYHSEFGPCPHLEQWYRRHDWSEQELQSFRDAYDGCIKYADAQIGVIRDRLQEQGLLDDTLIVVVSDHGELFGEHGLTDHGNSLYNPLLHVPLVMRLPSVIPGDSRQATPVSLRDLPATICDLVGLTPATPFPGRTLARLWHDGDDAGAGWDGSPLLSQISQGINRDAREPHSKGDMHSLYRDGLHLIRNGDGVLELYDLRVDPLERTDIANTERGKPIAARLNAEITRLLAR